MLRLVLAALLGALSGCHGRAAEPRSSAIPEPTIREDVAGLSRVLRLPATVQAVRWCETLRVAPSRAPGPTDRAIYAVATLDEAGWQALEGERLHRRARLRLPGGIARRLLPDGMGLADAGAGDVRAEGEEYELGGLTASSYAAGSGVRVKHQLLVMLSTM